MSKRKDYSWATFFHLYFVMNSSKNKKALLPLFITVLIDMLGVGLIIPIFAPLIVKNDFGILPIQSTEQYRNIVYGFLTASYTLFQFFGAPILGSLADQFGRKKILQLSLIGTFLGYIIFALAIYQQSLLLLFVARALPGFTGGNVSIIYASIADISEPQNKAKNFGLIGIAFGLGFILGPFIGGILCDSSLVSWFNYATPLWVTAGFTLVNIYYVHKHFPETFQPIKTAALQINWAAGLQNIFKALRLKKLRIILMTLFLQTFGFAFFMQFYQVYLIHQFSATPKDIGSIFGFIGIWLIITQGFLQRVVFKNVAPEKVLSFSIIGLSLALLLILVPQQWWLLFLVQPLIPICQGLTQPNITSLVSSMADKNMQGEILGIQQSMQALSLSIPPILAGFIVNIDYRLPIFIASCFMLIAWIVFVTLFKSQKTNAS